MKTCKCGAEMKLIPAGISKKNGKPYPAFYSCPNCKATENAVVTPVQKFEQQINKEVEDEKWNKRNKETKENIRWCNALNNACLLYANNYSKDGSSKLASIEEIANWLYKLEPHGNKDEIRIEDIE